MTRLDGEKDLLLLQGLLDAFDKLGVRVDFAKLSVGDVQGKGGLAKIKDRKILVVDRDLHTRDMAELLADELAQLDTEDLFLTPHVREAVEARRKK